MSELESAPKRVREPLRCPNDGSRLVEVERSEIFIDACPECRGVWLDRGELDKILVRERQIATSDPDEDFFGEVEGHSRRRDHETEAHEDSSGRKRRRRGLLEDLLDFD
jgi:Zn-finger nucleic acid-binding protein